MKKFIVTGASGFIGKSLTHKLLADGNSVLALVQDKSKMNEFFNNNKFDVLEATFEDYVSLDEKIRERNFDVFYHCAWDGTFGESFRDYHTQMNNASFAGDAANLAIKIRCNKFVLLSTIVAIETKSLSLKNEVYLRTSCIYGSAKIAAEILCKTICFQNHIDYNTAVIGSVYGVGDRSKMIQNIVLLNLNRGISPKLVEGNNLYDWVYIDDAVDALMLIGNMGYNQKTYYVGSKDLITFKEIIEKVKNIINPSVALKFGEFPDNTKIDYSLINIAALYEDTGFIAGDNFKENILKTSKWVKKLDSEGWFD